MNGYGGRSGLSVCDETKKVSFSATIEKSGQKCSIYAYVKPNSSKKKQKQKQSTKKT